MTEIQTVTAALRQFGIEYSCSDDILRIKKSSIASRFPGAPDSELTDTDGSYARGKAALNSATKCSIAWSSYDDTWFCVDAIRVT